MYNESCRVSLDNIERAAGVIDPVFLRTPQFVCEPLGDVLGARVALKVETLNPIRSFKGRGADFLVSQAGPAASFMCASAGNFGQAMAYACRKRAALVENRDAFRGRTVGTILCGGNLTPEQLKSWL